MSLPTIQQTHDDNFQTFIGPAGTTLVLATDSYILTTSNANVQSPKLTVYADTIIVPSDIVSKGKNLSIHCNSLRYRIDADKSTLINVTGANGDTLPSTDNPSKNLAVQGQDGGKVILHVHDLKLYPGKDFMRLEVFNLKFDFRGGKAGSTFSTSGQAGSNGHVEIYYSNALMRAFASLRDEYYQSRRAPERLGVLRTHVIPVLDQEIQNTIKPWPKPANGSWLKVLTESWIGGLKDVRTQVDHWLEVHTAFVNCADLLKRVQLPTASISDGKAFQTFLADMNKLRDLSIVSTDDCGKFSGLRDALQSFASLKADASVNEKEIAIDWITSQFKTVNACVAKIRESFKDKTDWTQIETPLYTTIDKCWNAFREMMNRAENDVKDPNSTINCVSVQKQAFDSLQKDTPLVHPDHCLMTLARADAAFFAEDFVEARARYLNLREKLSFVPRISENKNLENKDLPDERWPLYNALARLQNEEKLALWVFETLSTIYQQVDTRINQLSLGMDMFNLENNWAPRLSFKFYLDYAGQQLERLKLFEKSYWQFFDAMQAQAQVASTFRDAQAINIYRVKDAEDRIKSAVASIKRLEGEINTGDTDFQVKRKKFKEELEKVENALKKYRYVDPARIVGTVATFLVAVGLAVFGGPLGWIGAGACAGSGISQSIGMADDAKTQIKDTYGVLVNKNYVISDINTSEGDLDALMIASAYTTEADGTKTINAETNAKIVATEEQVQKFLKQFKDKFPENKGLSDALDAFTKASKDRNAKIAAYNSAVMDLYQQIVQRDTLANQGRDISQQLVRENQGLPSIVGYYRRVRDEVRLAILRTLKLSALALAYWGLHDVAKFSTPSLLSTVDELAAHLGVMLAEYEYCLAYFGDYSQVRWPAAPMGKGILYKLSQLELDALKVNNIDPFNSVDNVGIQWNLAKSARNVTTRSADAQQFTTVISGLHSPVSRGTTILDNPFAGHANVRITQVSFWAPGLKYIESEKTASSAGSATATATFSRLVTEIRHEGVETIVDTENRPHLFKHHPVYLLSESNPSVQLDDMTAAVHARQAMTSDWTETNSNALSQSQSPLGPFADWRIVIREKDQGGPLDWTDVTEAYLEFEGFGMPFTR